MERTNHAEEFIEHEISSNLLNALLTEVIHICWTKREAGFPELWFQDAA